MAWNKPLPSLDEEIEPFWQGLKRHQFLLMRCKGCGRYYWPAAYCRFCPPEPLFGNMEWVPSSGRGRVFAFNVHHQAFHPGFAQELPYVYALIELEEGPMFGSNIVGCQPQEVHIGMPVEVVYEEITPEFTLPKFRPLRT